jgi:predicted nucleic acid-binding protein
MKIIIDTNRIIASMIKDGVSRTIIMNQNFEFYAPEHTFSEIYKYEKEITRKAKITHEEFGMILSIIFERIRILPKEEYKDYLTQSKNLITDIGDVPFIAACLALKADGIWSDDTDFLKQKKVRVYATSDMIKLL